MVGSVRAHVESGALVVTLGERADLLSAERLRRALVRCTAHHPPFVIVDCARAGRSKRLASLLNAAVLFCNARRPGITMVVSAPNVAVRRVLRGRVKMFSTLTAALTALPSRRTHTVREHVRLQPEISGASVARALVRSFCERHALGGEVLEAGELIVSELVSNAVQHAGTTVDVTLSHYRRQLRIAVADRSTDLPRFGGGAEEPGLPVRGRGLDLVARSAARCGVLLGSDGKVVWARLPVPRRRWRRTRASVAALGRVASWRPVVRRRFPAHRPVIGLRPA
ncbi:anti-sigma regulatory factor (Ser/Thr protein kinase) [Catenuloplanes nepalensis]|uniref:Anti-sigma regulatory factor (Ser/Thr protein kinase) n=1 Tax=Catenuloplanes nepalensis TaxID=587533 RepID=A0ABT9MVA4_9ACTN|nr:ATP-binding protein [Catenuloplanes nepalensis]MDP9795382.1 anti-sigma regulatory factor (Ser/Thr protein kinase) [Catenuloplanes nepalensis]